ncbi:HU family DNA-binding protein [Siminovitchia fordii]|uniref:DNA-binding protein HU 1 n=1 Tax=Siminovitchia fordii TaxID=254759 RepID=A0ABQ4KBI3_9BACI|nr:HU family DNA-binding protein [Siminovitchia fordii]GIN23099.1 DNA-binding protein HU 1 [Siminovitchia fordii]
MLKKKDLAKHLQGVLSKKGNKVNLDEAIELIDDVLNGIVKLTKENGKLQLYSFGNFEVKERKERNGRSPATGETMIIPAHNVFTFKAAKRVKDIVR